MSNKIGFIGLGTMGKPMAMNLLKKGEHLVVNDINMKAVEELVLAGAEKGDYKQIADECDIVFLILPNGVIVERVLFGEGGLYCDGLRHDGQTVVDMSSVTPNQSKKFYSKLQELGVSFLDAPVSGGEPKAKDGTLAFMVGGNESVFNRALPIILKMGASAILVGASGCGSMTKLLNQVIVNNTIACVSEGMVLASKAGVDLEKAYKAIRGGLAGSAVLDAKVPMMLNRSFEPGGSLTINIKDMNNVMEAAKDLEVSMPYSSMLLEIMKVLKVHGHIGEDHSAIVKYFEKLSDCEVIANKNKTKTIKELEKYGIYDESSVEEEYKSAIKLLNKKIVVIDDDPTGVQTVHDVPVYTSWKDCELLDAFSDDGSLFYILTNSRGVSEEETIRIQKEISSKVVEASKATGKDFLLISRSDSTLRGHYPIETETLRSSLEAGGIKRFDGEIIVPCFPEGGRLTFDDIHYVKEGDILTPAALTIYAKDKTFEYSSSDIKEYVEEKTKGKYLAENVISISLDDLRSRNYQLIEEKLRRAKDFSKIIVNAISYADLKVFTISLIHVMQDGYEFIFRSAASIVKVLGGITDRPLLEHDDLVEDTSSYGGLIVIGSHVEKTTQQFNRLRESSLPFEYVEFNQYSVLNLEGKEEIDRVSSLMNSFISSGKNVVVYTRRERVDAIEGDALAQLKLARQISDAITKCVKNLDVKPKFIIAKGGITSSDIGTIGLGVRKALVVGNIVTGVPVWRIGEESRFPNLKYVIFPGNVGDDNALVEASRKLIGK